MQQKTAKRPFQQIQMPIFCIAAFYFLDFKRVREIRIFSIKLLWRLCSFFDGICPSMGLQFPHQNISLPYIGQNRPQKCTSCFSAESAFFTESFNFRAGRYAPTLTSFSISFALLRSDSRVVFLTTPSTAPFTTAR